jgi:hypothetical protein
MKLLAFCQDKIPKVINSIRGKVCFASWFQRLQALLLLAYVATVHHDESE